MALRLDAQPEYPVTDLLRVYLAHQAEAPQEFESTPGTPQPWSTELDDLWDRLGDFA